MSFRRSLVEQFAAELIQGYSCSLSQGPHHASQPDGQSVVIAPCRQIDPIRLLIRNLEARGSREAVRSGFLGSGIRGLYRPRPASTIFRKDDDQRNSSEVMDETP